MADKPALNATFFAFRKRERGGVLLTASLAYTVLAVLVFSVFAWLNWQAFADYFTWTMTLSERSETIDPNDPNALSAMMPPASVMSIIPAYTLMLLLFYLLFAAYEAACLRWMIHGEVKGLFGLALDADTLRVYFTYWIWFFLLMAIYFVVAIVALGLGVGAALSAGGGGDVGQAGAAMLVAVVACLALFVAVIFIAVRFAPAAATSIAAKRFAFFDAWKVTKGRFWALLGSFLLLFLMFFVGACVLSVGLGLAMGMGMMGQIGAARDAAGPDEVMALLASPAIWIPLAGLYALMIIGSFVFYVAIFGVNARAAQAALEQGLIKKAA